MVDAMIAAPRLGVFFDHRRGETAQNRVPPRAITAIVSNHKVGGISNIRPRVHVLRSVDPRDGSNARVRVANCEQLLSNFFQHGIRLSARLYDAVTLPAPQIQIQAIETQTISSSA